MNKAKINNFYIVFLALALSSASALAQNYNYQTYPPNNSGGYYNTQGQNYDQDYYNDNKSYNQNYYQDNQGYNQNYSQNYGQNYNQRPNLPPLQGRVVVAPAGTSLSVRNTTALSSAVNNVGDQVRTRLSSDLYAGGGLVLPAGSIIEGQITQLESAGRTGKNGIIGVRFTNAITPNGQRVPISARLATQDGSGLIRGGTTKGRVAKSALSGAVGAGIGAALGTALAPAAGGRVGKGAVYGTAIGGGAGLLSNVVRKGNEAELPTGTELQIVLDQPLTVQGQSQQGNYQNYGGNYNDNNYYGGY
jgi:hypothetical protein